ncbi:MAG: LytTR family DNA-binding domain-containing protein, partial [Verrucomicrobiota bacterium]
TWRGFAFFWGVPLGLAAVTVTTSGYSESLGLGWAFLYVSHLSLIPWWIGEGTTRLVHFGLRKFQPPLWVVCLIGVLLACVFVGPYVSLVSTIFDRFLEAGQGSVESGGDSGVSIFLQIFRAIVFWIAANYFFDRFLHYPRFRYDNGSESEADSNGQGESPETDVGLLRKLRKISSLSQIILVKADEHYVLVKSREDQEMISYRFGAAVADLEKEDGFQVHRSHWVRRSSVTQVCEEESQLSLELEDGSTVPVSRPYHELVRQIL